MKYVITIIYSRYLVFLALLNTHTYCVCGMIMYTVMHLRWHVYGGQKTTFVRGFFLPHVSKGCTHSIRLHVKHRCIRSHCSGPQNLH